MSIKQYQEVKYRGMVAPCNLPEQFVKSLNWQVLCQSESLINYLELAFLEHLNNSVKPRAQATKDGRGAKISKISTRAKLSRNFIKKNKY